MEQVTQEVGLYFNQSLRGVANFDRHYSDEFANTGAKIGDTLKIRLPQQWEAVEGEALEVQNILDQTVTLILNRRRHVGFGYSSAQETTDLDEIRSRYVQPAAETLAAIYDRISLADVYKKVYNWIGTLGTTPSAGLTFSTAVARILDAGGPDEGLVAILNPLTGATMANTTAALFHPSGPVTENYRRGQMAHDQLGISKWFMDQNIPRFTSGACTGASTPLVNGAGQTGSSIITDGWGSGTSALVEGDVVTFAGVYGVHPISKESTGRLQQFTLTAAISDTTGAITLPISPSIITSGPLQTVTAAPANNAVVTYWAMAAGGTQAATVSPQNLVHAPKAFASAMVDLKMPRGGANGTRVNSKSLALSIRYVEQYAITSDQNLNRLDILFGTASPYPWAACRVVA